MKQAQDDTSPARDRLDDRVTGEFTLIDGIEVYQIANFDRMPPFLMSVVSDSDHWMYAATAGGLAAGRIEPERSLFPYETDDRLYRVGGSTGPFTLLRVCRGDAATLWEPLTDWQNAARGRRNLYKSLSGDTIILEEARDDLGLTFRYRWSVSGEYGFVRTATLVNDDPSAGVSVEIIDGLRNLMPANVPLGLQQSSGTLVEAYRRNEVDPETGMAIYSLEARISDRAEPAESMHANIVWSIGLPDSKVLLATEQIGRFRSNEELHSATVTKGCRGHYLLNASVELAGAEAKSWMIVGDVHQTQLRIQQRRAQLLQDGDLAADVVADVNRGSERLRYLIATADGEQCTNDRMATTHHFANTLFNCMRGGVFVNNGLVPTDDLARFIEHRNRAVHRTHEQWLASLGDLIDRRELLERASAQHDPDLDRLCQEYLPIAFSRRHGDPSRPWNMFAIRVQDEEGNQILDYQGNWRDIFQNWEALCYSFPSYFESIVAKFVNASTVDGFNPYRVTRDGIDWEAPDPDNAWSNIGYWGDHQIVYLLRLLEGLSTFDAGALPRMLHQEVYSYADVPYRIRPYDAILRNSKSTIEFDADRNREIEDRATIIGSDGKLLRDHDGSVLHVTLAEKLLVPALAKLGNLVVDGGIWMNTQRPEWNDANNALVGYGLSMVTLSHFRRYLAFCADLFADQGDNEFVVSAEVATWMEQTLTALVTHRGYLEEPLLTDRHRKEILDWLGSAFSEYRAAVYEHSFSGKANVSAKAMAELCRVALEYADHSLSANRQDSGLYHSYNLLRLADEGWEMAVERLPVMLEGQVAALSSGVMSSEEVLAMVDALYVSPLHRTDQDSFTLYPAKELPGFLERNVIPQRDVDSNPLLLALLEANDTTVVEEDSLGICRFAPSVASNVSLVTALDQLSAQPEWTDLVAHHRVAVHETFEKVFQHRRFTGRSGSMYKYEGLGSIYWHMVAKLLLAVQEAFWRSRTAAETDEMQDALAAAYYRVRAGLSSDKSPAQYGAFPADPYSHSPSHMGAQQPGMTGQVKEEVLTRWGELGIRVTDGMIEFDPALLRRREFLKEPTDWSYYDTAAQRQTLTVPSDAVAFTYCQVPIVYRIGSDAVAVQVSWADGSVTTFDEPQLDKATSAAVFERSGRIGTIDVVLPEATITRP
ncbi:MAG: hypothetical protein QNJ81_15570 [Acidimicrobiia bacterium]|nr:hypothetical protein [Acidimicrobiia bacterium]